MIDKCKELSLEGFVNCLCDQNYDCLGEGSETEKRIAWEKIYAEYITLMEDQVLIRAQALRIDIVYWELKYEVIESSVYLLKKWRDEELLKTIIAEGHNLEFSKEDPEAYKKDLERVLVRSKNIITTIANLQHELKELTNELAKDDKPFTRLDMMVNIMQFGKFMGFQINMKETMVDGFAAIRNLYYKQLNTLSNERK